MKSYKREECKSNYWMDVNKTIWQALLEKGSRLGPIWTWNVPFWQHDICIAISKDVWFYHYYQYNINMISVWYWYCIGNMSLGWYNLGLQTFLISHPKNYQNFGIWETLELWWSPLDKNWEKSLIETIWNGCLPFTPGV